MINSITPVNGTSKQFIFTYRDGIQSLPIFSIVQVPLTTLHRDVIVKCQKYCKQKNMRYVSVRPMIIDLDEGSEFSRTDGKVEIIENVTVPTAE